jgi:hypothetical protein
MPANTLSAIKITIYTENDEVKKNYQRLIIPWGLMKRAVEISKSIGKQKKQEDISEEQLDQISDLLVELFGNVFTREDLEAGADVVEVMACFSAIIARAKGVVPNAKPPTG